MLDGQHVLPEGMDCAAGDRACKLARVRLCGGVGGKQRVGGGGSRRSRA